MTYTWSLYGGKVRHISVTNCLDLKIKALRPFETSVFNRWHGGTSLRTWSFFGATVKTSYILLCCSCLGGLLIRSPYLHTWGLTFRLACIKSAVVMRINCHSFNYILIKIEMFNAFYLLVIKRFLKLPN